MSFGKIWYYSLETGMLPLPLGPDESMSESTVRSFKRLRGLGGMIAAKNGDLDVRGGKCSLTPNPNQAFEKGQVNSNSSPKGYFEGMIGY